jgi:hypothetical protein
VAAIAARSRRRSREVSSDDDGDDDDGDDDDGQV